MALNRFHKRTIACLRQPSMGPFFGVKGGGVGGGYSQVAPEDDINLHLTGDIHAVTQAHNLAASFLDNHLYRAAARQVSSAILVLTLQPRAKSWRSWL